MGLLKRAQIEKKAAKVGVFGLNGSGKSLTAALIAIGLSKTFHDGAPVAMHDTEDASDFLVPVFEAERIDFIRHKSTAFKDTVATMREASKEGACAWVGDTLTRVWVEIVESYKKDKRAKRLDFQQWGHIKSVWREHFVDLYMTLLIHGLIVGRSGDEYDTVEDVETGKLSQERSGSKFAAEKGVGYEPDLLIEMEGRRLANAELAGKKKRVRKQGGQIAIVAHVVKDRSRALMGQAITFPAITSYKPGDWKPVYQAFAPHWAFLVGGNSAASTMDVKASSSELFGEDHEQSRENWGRRKDIAVEEIKGILNDRFPGADADSKKKRAEIGHELFDTWSWTAVEAMSVQRLEEAVGVLQVFSSVIKREGIPSDVDGVVKALKAARRLCGEETAAELAKQAEAADRAANLKAEDEALAAAGELPL